MRSKYLSVYVHIPFCVRKCLYCDFPSVPYDEGKETAYIKALLCEIESAAKLLDERSVKTVYFGGGTPSVIPAAHIRGILESLKNNLSFDEDPEITIEMNPKTVNEEKIEIYLSSGINRFSLGMQSAVDPELEALGRIHDSRDSSESFKLLRRLGVKNINLDVMTGIPHQNPDSLKTTLKDILALKPEHISAYALIIEPGTPFYETGREGLDLPDEDEEMQMYEFTRDLLRENGYERYEISNYAVSGRECAHNLVYWDCLDYIGFGCSASSRLGSRRFTNIRDIDAYIADPVENRMEDLVLSAAELMSEFVFMGMRKVRGIGIRDFQERFNRNIFGVYGSVLSKYIDQGLIINEGDRLFFSRRGMDVSNMILSDFI